MTNSHFSHSTINANMHVELHDGRGSKSRWLKVSRCLSLRERGNESDTRHQCKLHQSDTASPGTAPLTSNENMKATLLQNSGWCHRQKTNLGIESWQFKQNILKHMALQQNNQNHNNDGHHRARNNRRATSLRDTPWWTRPQKTKA